MDDPSISLPPDVSAAEPTDETSQPFVGRWNHLVSTTNWEKGQIIAQWRDALIDQGAASSEYSDDAWSRRVGGITPQHAGRLRRVSQRFGPTFRDFEGLYWSHFQAALDWDDAEMWLEGAVRSSWSVSRMRNTRWETLGAIPDQQPHDVDIVTAEIDEDFEPAADTDTVHATPSESYSEVQAGPRLEGPDFGDDDGGTESSPPSGEDSAGAATFADGDEQESIDFIRPFASLGELPEDLSDAFDAFKLAILHHKTDNWEAISSDDVLASLEALKALVTAP